jgi:hypothetical protein
MNDMTIKGLWTAGIAAVVLAVGCVNPVQPQPAANASPPPGIEPVRVQPQPLRSPPREVPVDQMEASLTLPPEALTLQATNGSQGVVVLLGRRLAGGAVAVPPSQAGRADPQVRSRETPPQITASADSSASELVRAVIEPSADRTSVPLSPVPPLPPAGTLNPLAPVPDPAIAAPRMSRGSAGSLLDRLVARIHENPRDMSAHLEYQLLQLLLDAEVPELSTLGSLPAEDRELVMVVLEGISLFRSTLRSDNNMLLSRKIGPLIEMAHLLRSQAELSIPTLAVCRSVSGFGRYEPIDPVRFIAGIEQQAIIYCEVANFASNLNDSGLWETRLKQEMVLYTESFGAAVWSDQSEVIVDSSRVRRNDFFVNKRILIPANLTMGRYLLKVSIVDLQANRFAEASVPIIIAAQ